MKYMVRLMKKRIFSVLLAAAVFLGTVMAVSADEKTAVYEMKTLLMEERTGTVVSESGGYDRVPQGTLNKLMTVLLVAEEIVSGNMSPDTVLTASSNANAQKGAVVWLMPGEEISVDELLKAVIIGNANDAAMVFAEEIGGSEEEFVGMMNARAFELGMRDTVFKNAAGYDCEGQYSTAHDIALLCRELLKHDFLQKYMTTWIDNVRDGQTEVVNENKLVRTYDGITGLKASHSEQSGWCLALSAKRDDKSYIAVVMGCDDENERFSTAKSLMAQGFSYYKITTPEFSGEFIKPVTVRGGLDSAVCITAESLEGLVVPESDGEISTVIFMPQYLEAPVKKGQRVGTVGFYNGDTLLYETSLVTQQAVKKIEYKDALNIVLCNLYK